MHCRRIASKSTWPVVSCLEIVSSISAVRASLKKTRLLRFFFRKFAISNRATFRAQTPKSLVDMGTVNHTEVVFEAARDAGLRATIGKAKASKWACDLRASLEVDEELMAASDEAGEAPGEGADPTLRM